MKVTGYCTGPQASAQLHLGAIPPSSLSEPLEHLVGLSSLKGIIKERLMLFHMGPMSLATLEN